MWLPIRNTCAILGLCLLALCHGAAAAAATNGSISVVDAFEQLAPCAQTCFMKAVSNSTCALTNSTCICNDESLNDAATACITAACTVKESLTAKNLTCQLCGIPATSDETLIPIYSVFIGLATIAVVLRLVARILTQAYFWWDDLSCFIAFMCAAVFTGVNIKSIQLGQSKDIWFVPFDNITEIVEIFYFEMLLYTITRFFVRASIILFYMRVFPPQPDNKLGRIVQGTFVFNVIYNISFLMAVIFQCSPVSYFWGQWEGLHEGHCGDANILAWVAAATGLVFDLWLLGLPFSQLLKLDLHWKRKVMGGLMFFVGVAVMIISLIRLKTVNEFTRAVNPTKDIVQVSLWSGLELDVGVICPCLPSFRLLLRRLLPRVMGTSGLRYEMDPVSGNKSGLRKSGPIGGPGMGGMGGGQNGMLGTRTSISGGRDAAGSKIVVENTIAVKYGKERAAQGDAGSFESVAGLVDGRAPQAGEADHQDYGYGQAYGHPGYDGHRRGQSRGGGSRWSG